MPVITRTQSKKISEKNNQIFIRYMNKMFDKSKMLCKKKETYYENMRIVTEIFYAVGEWFDIVLVVDGVVKTPKFINSIYNKYLELKYELENDAPKNQTEEEQYIIKVFLNQMQETAEKLKPYVTDIKQQEKTREKQEGDRFITVRVKDNHVRFMYL